MVQQISSLRKEIQFIVLMGANGAGKNKKGKILCELAGHLGVYRIVMSDLIKDHRRLKTELGIKFEEELHIEASGGLLSDPSIFEAFELEVLRIYALYKASGYKGTCKIVLDGFPRNVAQLKRFINYRVPYIICDIEIDELTCLSRVTNRALTEGPRNDDAKAADRFKLLTENKRLMLRILKATNPQSIISINGTLPVREQITRILKKAFNSREIMRLVKCFDIPKHPARVMMDEIEGKKPQGGASAHSLPPGAEHEFHRGVTIRMPVSADKLIQV